MTKVHRRQPLPPVKKSPAVQTTQEKEVNTYQERSVYVLVDPSVEQAFYVGVSTEPYQRFIAHLQCRDNNEAKNEYIAGLKQRNLVPAMHILHCSYGAEETHAKIEAHYIDLFRKNGQPLTNQHLRIGFVFNEHEQAMVEHGAVGKSVFTFTPDTKHTQDWQDYLKLCREMGIADPDLTDNKWRWRNFQFVCAMEAAKKQEWDEALARWNEWERRILPYCITILFIMGGIGTVGSAYHGDTLFWSIGLLLEGLMGLLWYMILAKQKKISQLEEQEA